MLNAEKQSNRLFFVFAFICEETKIINICTTLSPKYCYTHTEYTLIVNSLNLITHCYENYYLLTIGSND